MSNFEVNINLGNVAMATREDIANALHEIAHRLQYTAETGKVILDANGNTIGNWWLVLDDEDDDTESEDDGQGDDVWADSDALASAGHGTDEDYGFYGNDDY